MQKWKYLYRRRKDMLIPVWLANRDYQHHVHLFTTGSYFEYHRVSVPTSSSLSPPMLMVSLPTYFTSSNVISVIFFQWRNPLIPLWPHKYTVSQPQTQISQMPFKINLTRSPFRIAGMSSHTQTSWPYQSPIWNCIPFCHPIPTHSWSKHLLCSSSSTPAPSGSQ